MFKVVNDYPQQNKNIIIGVGYMFGRTAKAWSLLLNKISDEQYIASMSLHIHWLNPLLHKCRKRLCPVRS